MPEYVLDCSLAKETRAMLDRFTLAYVEAAMWTLTDGENGEPCDHLGLHDIAPETIAAAIEVCSRFQVEHAELLSQAGDDSQNGHDLLLTRDGHGAGFWDRGYAEDIGRKLTDAAHAEGESNWYVGDDGMVYSS